MPGQSLLGMLFFLVNFQSPSICKSQEKDEQYQRLVALRRNRRAVANDEIGLDNFLTLSVRQQSRYD